MKDDNSDCIVKRGSRSTRLPRRTSVPVSAAAAVATFPAAPYSSHDGAEQDLAVDLDYVPVLGPLREFLCVLGPVLLVLAAYVATGRLHGGSLIAKMTSVVAAASCVSLARTAWMEKEYKARERAHAALGDRDSRFRPITAASAAAAAAAGATHGPRGSQHAQQLVVHVKVKVGDVPALRGRTKGSGSESSRLSSAGDGVGTLAADGNTAPNGGAVLGAAAPAPHPEAALVTAEAAPGGVAAAAADGDGGAVCAVHCYHGFGANLGSYKRVQDGMAAALRGVVTAHDMPGFGLTQRPSDMSSYFLTFNGRLGRLVLDYELQQLGLLGGCAADGGGATAAATAAEPRQTAGSKGVQSTFTPPADSADNGGALIVTVGAPAAAAAVAEDGGGGGEVKGRGAPQQAARSTTAPAATAVAEAAEGQQRRPAIKRILIGHSLGGACAALEAVTDPEGLAGLVLVAPAIFALPGSEYSQVTLSPDRPRSTGRSGAAAAAAAAGAGAAAGGEEQRTAAARAAAHLGSEPPGTHVTDPPEVRRLYPVGQMPSAGVAGGGGGNGSGGGGGNGRAGGGGGRRLLRAAGALVRAAASLALLLVLKLLTPIITLLLRSLVRRRTFWIKGLQQAYYNPDALTPDLVDAYRMPQLVRGWEAGMVNFLLARLALPRAGLGALFRDALQGGSAAAAAAASRGAAAAAAATTVAASAVAADGEASNLAPATPPLPSSSPTDGPALDGTSSSRSPSSSFSAAATAGAADGGGDDADLASRLSALVSERRLPVLIVHGLYDRLVPASNSQRLARMLPGCELVLLDRCGHMPQEEMPGLFVDLVAEFAARLEPRGA